MDNKLTPNYYLGYLKGWKDCLKEISEFSCDGDCSDDPIAQAYQDGYNSAIKQVVEILSDEIPNEIERKGNG